MFSMGVFGWLGHQLLTNAHNYAPANLLIPFGYSFIIYNTIWSFLISSYAPDMLTVLGGFFIVSSGLMIWVRELKNQNKPLNSNNKI